MSYFEFFMLGIGLSFDTLAVSLVGGSCMKNPKVGQILKICLTFAFVQALFTCLGWLLGSSFYQFISKFDHWVAFALLLFIGGKMVVEGFCNKGEENVDLLSFGKLTVSAIATSIDALAVGISMAMIGMSTAKNMVGFAIIGAVTALAALLGLKGGSWISRFMGNKAGVIGGLILVAIGVKIVVEHLISGVG